MSKGRVRLRKHPTDIAEMSDEAVRRIIKEELAALDIDREKFASMQHQLRVTRIALTDLLDDLALLQQPDLTTSQRLAQVIADMIHRLSDIGELLDDDDLRYLDHARRPRRRPQRDVVDDIADDYDDDIDNIMG